MKAKEIFNGIDGAIIVSVRGNEVKVYLADYETDEVSSALVEAVYQLLAAILEELGGDEIK